VENYVKLFGLTAVIALAVGGSFAFSVAMTRWEFIGLLDPSSYYTHLSIHAWNLLIFWMVFMEIAVLYVGGPMVLGRALPLRRLATVGWGTMVAGAIGVNASIWLSEAPNEAPASDGVCPAARHAVVLRRGNRLPARGHDRVAAVLRDDLVGNSRQSANTPTRRLRCVRHRIIAVEAIFGGIAAFAYALAWRIDLIASVDPGIYRQLYWIVGHGTQQINLLAMITVWYFLTHVVGAPS